jgi:uncharacterized GH25 family protein
MMNRMQRAALLSGAAMLVALPSLAHTQYLKPNIFTTPQRDHVTVEGSFTEELFTPDIAMKADDYHVVTPAGARTKIANVIYLKDLAVFEADLPENGTYRFSSGERPGATRKMALVDGKWQPLRDPKEAPAGARVADAQSFTRADVYVTKGPANDTALKPTGSGLEFVPLVNPSRLDEGASFPVQVLYEGKPLAGVEVSLQGGGSEHGHNEKGEDVHETLGKATTDKDGKVSLALKEHGTYLILARHRVEWKEGPVAVKSHSVTLTFQVED